MNRARCFLRRWRYTLTAIFCVILPSVAMLFFDPARPYGLTIIILFLFLFIVEGLKYL